MCHWLQLRISEYMKLKFANFIFGHIYRAADAVLAAPVHTAMQLFSKQRVDDHDSYLAKVITQANLGTAVITNIPWNQREMTLRRITQTFSKICR